MRVLVNDRGDRAVVAQAVFASHAWNNSFLDFVDAMENHFGRGSATFVWNGKRTRGFFRSTHGRDACIRSAVSAGTTRGARSRRRHIHGESAQRWMRPGPLALPLWQQTPSAGPELACLLRGIFGNSRELICGLRIYTIRTSFNTFRPKVNIKRRGRCRYRFSL